MSSAIWALFLRPEHQGRGIGHALMAWSSSVAEIELTTEPGTRAQRLYRTPNARGGTRKVDAVTENGSITCAPIPRHSATGQVVDTTYVARATGVAVLLAVAAACKG